MSSIPTFAVPTRSTALSTAFVAAEHLGGVVLVADVAFCRVDGDFSEGVMDAATHFDSIGVFSEDMGDVSVRQKEDVRGYQ